MNESDEMLNGTKSQQERKFMLTDESFQLLRKAQQKIGEATELMPSMRKLVNALITEEGVDELSQQFIQEMSISGER